MSALKQEKQITWFEPKRGDFTPIECKVFEITVRCPERCGGELRWNGESMSASTYGPQSHYHKCTGCQGVWLIKGRYPYQQYVRPDHLDSFKAEFGLK